MSRTAVIVVNTNGAADTARCAYSLSRVRQHPPLVVVDNASSTGGLEEAVAGYPKTKLLYSPVNLGFGRANNLGVRWAFSHTDCEFIFLLNNDAMVGPDTIARLENTLDDHPGAGVAAPRIVLAEQPDALWYGGGEVDWRKGAPTVPGYLGPADADLALAPRNVTFASGCAMMIRRSVLEKVGGFDPRLFLYTEDLELCLRIREAGWTIRYDPEALVLHKGQSWARKEGEAFTPILSPRNPRLPFYAFHVTKGRLLSMFVHARRSNALQFAWGFPAFCSLKCLQFALLGRWDAVRSLVLGAWEAVRVAGKPFVNELETGTHEDGRA